MEIPKVVIKEPNEPVVFYGFKNKELLNNCLENKCPLFQTDSAIKLDEVNMGLKLITTFCIETWRLEKRLNKLQEENLNLDLSTFFDQAQRLKDIFIREGIVIKDYTTGDYTEGISLKVLNYEEDPTLPPGVYKIVETVRPTIFYKDKVIFHGEVVVAKSTQNA